MGDILEVEMMENFSNFREIVYIFFSIWRNLGLRMFTKTPPPNANKFQAQNFEFMSGTSKLSGYEIIIPSISPSPTKGGAQNLHWLGPIFTKTVVKIIKFRNFTWKHWCKEVVGWFTFYTAHITPLGAVQKLRSLKCRNEVYMFLRIGWDTFFLVNRVSAFGRHRH